MNYLKIRTILIIFATVSFLTITACSEMKYEVPQVEQLPAIKMNDKKSHTLLLNKLMVNVPRGEIIGKVAGGKFCINPHDIIWKAGISSINDSNYLEIFNTELKNNGYEVIGASHSLFEEKHVSQAEYLVAGEITKISKSICYPNAGFGNHDKVKGGIFININWQVYSTSSSAVELSISTAGSSGVEQETDLGENELYLQAFKAAVHNLLGQEKFYNLISTAKTKS